MAKKCMRAAIICIALLSSAPLARKPRPSEQAHYFIGPTLMLNNRYGWHEFPAIEKRQDTVRSDVRFLGVGFGKRYPIASWLRWQLGFMLGGGNTKEGEFHFDRSYEVRHHFFSGALEASVHILPPAIEKAQPFISLGGGVNFLRFRERFFRMDGDGEEVQFSDLQRLESFNWSPGGFAGAGVDFRIRPDLGLTLGYAVRLWRPLTYDAARELPIEPRRYRELFLSQVIHASLLFFIQE
jgi:hypothetical protein